MTRKSKNTDSGFENLNKIDDLLEPDWAEDSSVTVNIHHQPIPRPSQFEAKTGLSKKQAGIGGAIVAVIAALVQLARVLGWLP